MRSIYQTVSLVKVGIYIRVCLNAASLLAHDWLENGEEMRSSSVNGDALQIKHIAWAQAAQEAHLGGDGTRGPERHATCAASGASAPDALERVVTVLHAQALTPLCPVFVCAIASRMRWLCCGHGASRGLGPDGRPSHPTLRTIPCVYTSITRTRDLTQTGALAGRHRAVTQEPWPGV